MQNFIFSAVFAAERQTRDSQGLHWTPAANVNVITGCKRNANVILSSELYFNKSLKGKPWNNYIIIWKF